MSDWNLILKTGFGNVFTCGRWDGDGAEMIAEAINSDDWGLVEEYAEWLPWDDATAN